MWPLRFAHPVALALLLPLTALAIWRRRLLRPLSLAAALCLALAVARPEWATQRRRVARAYALDLSGSTFVDTGAALAAIQESIRGLAPDDRVAVIAFAASPVVVTPAVDVQRLSLPLRLPSELPRASGTDLAAAIRLAARQVAAEGYDRQVVLLTDGRQTTGDAAAEAAIVAEEGLRVLVLPFGPTQVADARISRLHAPATVRRGEPFQLEVELVATAGLEATLTVTRDGAALAAPHKLSLEAGAPRRLVLTDRLDEPGPHVYSARLASTDQVPENNVAEAVVRVEGAARVLYLAQAAAPPLAGILRGLGGLAVDVLDPARRPIARADLLGTDCVVLDGVPSADLAPESQRAIRDWVRDSAGGLVALGGPTSYGPGGYAVTPIEEALPVLCSRPKSMAVVVALDESGSMGERVGEATKIAFAREAILRALGHLRPSDRFALLAFDGETRVLVPLGPAPSADSLARVLEEVEPHGPTELQLALERALRLAAQAPAQVRAVLLVSDGQATRLDVAALKEGFGKEGIALAVLMTGRDPEAITRLRDLAGPTFHLVSDPASLPSAFLDELRKVTYLDFLRQGAFAVQAAAEPELTVGASPAGPLAGYVHTVARPGAVVEWSAGEPSDPVLARWRFGLGRAVAFTTTVGTTWDERLWGPSGAATLWRQVVRWAARPPRTPGFEAEFAEQDGRMQVTVHAALDGQFLNGLRLTARVVPPEGAAYEAPLPQSAPGQYRMDFPAAERGVYHLTVVEEGKGPRLPASVVKTNMREWEAFGADRPAAAAIARNGNGEVLASLDALGEVTPRRAAGYVDLSWALALMGLGFFVLDVFFYVLRGRRARI